MPRIARKNLNGRYFHIMVQGIAKENIFPNDNAKGYYLSCMRNTTEKKPVAILGFCMMDNHAHLLLSAENISIIAQYMKLINAEYARYYNAINQRAGYVFRDRFKSEVIQNERYLINCLAYIHNNPVKAKIVKSAQDYNYSSYTNYLMRSGIVNFKEAKELYDISPENMTAIMKEKSHSNWLEHDDKVYEKYEIVLEELLKRYNVSSNKPSLDILAKIATELNDRTGVSFRKIADIFGIARENLRRALGRKAGQGDGGVDPNPK